MATSTVTGPNFEVSQKHITLFQLQGAHTGNNWAMSVPFGDTAESYVLTEVGPAPALDEIVSVIETDRAQGREHLIDHVLISSRVAVRLFLEGILTMEAFKDAEASDESILLTLKLSGRDRRVKIQSEFDLEYGVSTRDQTGAIV
ncbi:hypothetical protein KDA_75060 [Dictyobacter alpinus]|uniref:Uncharacterized protein n=1 Tax=Dictyobacter alpinus TaxID=2014873 RepID=A0A402BL09_9CHLR|nr:hypothetical protein [Dictyobacter alpinus]GCE32022.1 hypothetical protein KDA_75060 [Dictyobacter alpinus]